MRNDKITSLQYATLSFFLINSFLINVGFFIITNISSNDSILDILLGGLLILLVSYFILKIHHSEKLNIIDIISNNYSKISKLIIFTILIIVFSIAATYSLTTLVNFIHYYILKEVSVFTITITLTATILYIVSKELSTICRISEILFYIYLLVFIIGTIGLIKYMDFENLKPLLTTTLKSNVIASITYFISAIIPLFLLLVIPQNKVKWSKRKKPYPFILIASSIILAFFQLISIIAVLGIRLTTIFKNPDMIAFKKISFLNLLERMEIILSFNNFINGMFFIIMCIYFIKELLRHTKIKEKEHILLALIGLCLIFFSNTITLDISIYFICNLVILIILLLFLVHYFFHKYNHY